MPDPLDPELSSKTLPALFAVKAHEGSKELQLFLGNFPWSARLKGEDENNTALLLEIDNHAVLAALLHLVEPAYVKFIETIHPAQDMSPAL
jgi:hypothetical protein